VPCPSVNGLSGTPDRSSGNLYNNDDTAEEPVQGEIPVRSKFMNCPIKEKVMFIQSIEGSGVSCVTIRVCVNCFEDLDALLSEFRPINWLLLEFAISVFCISQRSHRLAVAPSALMKLGYPLECCDSVCPVDQKAV
jgi:hypothetical protein